MWKGIFLFQCVLDGAPSCLPLCLYNWSHSSALCQQAVWYFARFGFFNSSSLQLLLRKRCPWSLQAGWTRWPSEVPSNQLMVIWFYEKKKKCVQSLYSSLICVGETVHVCLMWGIYMFCAFVCQCMPFLLLWEMDTRCKSYLHLVPKSGNKAILNSVSLCLVCKRVIYCNCDPINVVWFQLPLTT